MILPQKAIIFGKTEHKPGLCRVDISVKKIQQEADRGGSCAILYHRVKEGLYLGSYRYHYDAAELQRLLKEHGVSTKKDGRYNNMVLSIKDGALYKTYSLRHKICSLLPSKNNKRPIYIGSIALECAIAAETEYLKTLLANMDEEQTHVRLVKWGKSYLERIVARTAIWATKDDYDAYPDGVRYPGTRRRKVGDTKESNTIETDPLTMGEVEVTLDSNNKPKYMMRSMLRYRYGLETEEYHTCHIWPGSCYDIHCHTNYANLVLIPSAIASLSDFDENIMKALQSHAYKLFRWFPYSENKPKRVDDKSLPWLNLPHKTTDNAHNRTSVF